MVILSHHQSVSSGSLGVTPRTGAPRKQIGHGAGYWKSHRARTYSNQAARRLKLPAKSNERRWNGLCDGAPRRQVGGCPEGPSGGLQCVGSVFSSPWLPSCCWGCLRCTRSRSPSPRRRRQRSDMQEPEGVTFEPIAITSGLTLPSPADMIAARFRIEPGATLPLEASDPTGGMLIVESGTFTVRVDTPWAISRSGSLASSIATAEASGTFTSPDEQIASGDEATLDAGDAAYIPGSISGEIRNDGTEAAVGLVVLVGPTEAMSGATPTP